MYSLDKEDFFTPVPWPLLCLQFFIQWYNAFVAAKDALSRSTVDEPNFGYVLVRSTVRQSVVGIGCETLLFGVLELVYWLVT